MDILKSSNGEASPWNLIHVIISAGVYMIYSVLYAVIYVINGLFGMIIFNTSHRNSTEIRMGRILWKRKVHIFDICSARDFLCIFSSMVDLNYVLKSNVSLYALTNHEAVFVETDASINIYSSDVNAFMYSSQFDHCQNVIKMPISYFHALAEKLGHPSVPVIWISQTGRCGSTLLCQVLEKVPGTLVMSEPDAPIQINILQYAKSTSEQELKDIFKSTVRVLCKPYPGAERICIKTRGACVGMMNDISKEFPDFRQIFIYRNCKETVSSYLAILSSIPYTTIGRFCYDSKWLSVVKSYFRHQMDTHFIRTLPEDPLYEIMKSKTFNTVTTFTYMWVNYMLIAREAINQNDDILPVKYENLLAEKREMSQAIFKKLGLNITHLNTALTAFDRDSQRTSLLSRARIGSTPTRLISDKEKMDCDIILAIYKFPLIGNDFCI